MKKLVIASAVAAVMASSAAFAETTVYGKASYYVELGTEDGVAATATSSAKDSKSVSNSSSRIGFKSSEDLGNGMTALAHFEAGTSDEQNDPTTVRLAYAGIKGDFGQVAIGSQWTPSYLLARGATDVFQSVGCNICKGNAAAPFRAADAISYINKFGDVTFAAAIVADEGTDLLTDAVDVGVSIPVGPVTIGLVMQKTDSDAAPDTSAVNVGYSAGDLALNVTAFMRDADESATDKGDDSLAVGVSYTIGAGQILAVIEDDGETGETMTNLGYAHSLSKMTTVHVEMQTGDVAADMTNVGLTVKF